MDINDPALFVIGCRFTFPTVNSLGGSIMAFVVFKHDLNIRLFEPMRRGDSFFPHGIFPFSHSYVVLLARF